MYAQFSATYGGHAIMTRLLKYGTFVLFLPLIGAYCAVLGEIPYFCNATMPCATAVWEAHAAPRLQHSQAWSRHIKTQHNTIKHLA